MNATAIDTLYRHCWSKQTSDLLFHLNQSLSPRSPAVLYEVLAALHMNEESSILDTGCGWGMHSCDLAARFNCRVTGVDLAAINVEMASQRAENMGVSEQITFLQGDIQALPFADAQFDFIWCYDVLEHLPALEQGLSECTRVLKSAGAMLIQTGFAAPTFSVESDEVYKTLHISQCNLDQNFFEKALDRVGWQIALKEQIESEWIEYFSERKEAHYGEVDPREHISLLHFSRLRRGKKQLIEKFGQEAYDVIYAIQFFQIQQILGNINPVVYLLKKK